MDEQGFLTDLNAPTEDHAAAAAMPAAWAATDRLRRARHRRAAVATAAAVALVTTAAAAVGVHLTQRHTAAPRPAATPRPVATSASSPILVYEDATVRRPDGTVVARLDAPDTTGVAEVIRVPSGWIFDAAGKVWFQSAGEPARVLVGAGLGGVTPAGIGGGNSTVTGDGSAFVVAETNRIVAYDLPSLHVRRSLERPGVQFFINEARGDEILADVSRCCGVGLPSIVWNARTGAVTTVDDLSGLRMALSPAGDTLLTGSACAAVRRAAGFGTCWSEARVPAALDGWRAPAGATVVPDGLSGLDGLYALHIPDSPADEPRLRPFDSDARYLEYWIDATRFVASMGLIGEAYVCDTRTLHCEQIALHTRTAGAGVVEVVDGG